jgi:hypothetical protein
MGGGVRLKVSGTMARCRINAAFHLNSERRIYAACHLNSERRIYAAAAWYFCGIARRF